MNGKKTEKQREKGLLLKKHYEDRKVVKVEVCMSQENLLKRSIIAESKKEIFFERVKNQIVEGWKGQGKTSRGLGVNLFSPNMAGIGWSSGARLDSAMILIDSNVYDFIHEWITLEEGDRKFDIYVREFGKEIFSAQTHPRTC
ncbi:hypothetical protein PIB30_019773 [Stylosanthes scabra]|uniref:Uncharacterized protein n=1 Tax=Stylosanthes scabra TaxID=79078 RepID=A0ABU6Y6W7_9FABA|nr:hypothetical protein [Stylosanthes scabra]